MHELLIDLRLVKRVWEDIEAHDDVRLSEKKHDMRTNCKELLDKCCTDAAQLSPTTVAEASALTQSQLAERSLHVVFDVLAFVGHAYSFYDMVKGYRPLTPEEQEIGKLLTLLTKQVQAIVPDSGEGAGNGTEQGTGKGDRLERRLDSRRGLWGLMFC